MAFASREFMSMEKEIMAIRKAARQMSKPEARRFINHIHKLIGWKQ
jgi:hypothetical protein